MKTIFALMMFSAACGGSADVMTATKGMPDLSQPVTQPTVDMAQATQQPAPDLSQPIVAPTPDMSEPAPQPDMLMCVLYTQACTADAQCCYNSGAAGSCAPLLGATDPNAKVCCMPKGHGFDVSQSNMINCCPGLSHGCDQHGDCACN